MRKHFPPWLTLLILAPLLGEIVSGHQPPLELFNPLSVLLLMLPYGFGALICRELVKRWRRGWPSLLLLGIAYALYEEGIVIRSIFNPEWMELESIDRFSRVFGVTWSYALTLVHFHVLVSIAASVILAEILHPDKRDKPWLGARGFLVCAIGLLLWWPLGWLMSAYVPPPELYAFCILLVIGLLLAARFFPAGKPAAWQTLVPHPILFLILGFANMTAFFAYVYVFPSNLLPPVGISILILAVLDAVTLWLLMRWSGNGGSWNDLHRLGWVAGGLGFFILFNFFSDLEVWEGKSLVAAATVAGLWWMGRKIKRAASASPVAARE
jgi:hypothetical protein